MTRETPNQTTAPTDRAFYVQDVDYPSGFIVDQMPVRLSYVAALRGFKPPDPDKPFTYCELGCSVGMTLNTLAAANPDSRFFGIDINASSITRAKRVAEDTGLQNVTYLDQPFDELRPVDFPQFDYITMQGTYSWLPPMTLESVIRFLGEALGPGGLFYVEFILLPALASAEPVAKLMRELSAHIPGNSLSRAEHALEKLISLCKHKAQYFVQNPQAVNAVAGWDKEREINPYWRENIAHAQLAGSWTPKYVTDVAAELSEAGLQRVGSTVLPLNDIRLSLPPDQLPALADTDDPLQMELITDYLLNRSKRQDVFIKDAMPDMIASRKFIEERISLLPRASAAALSDSIKIPEGRQIPLSGPLYSQMINVLDGQLTRFGDLLKHARLQTTPDAAKFTAATHLVASENYFLCIKPSIQLESLDNACVLSIPLPYNRYILETQARQLEVATLACPATGGGGVSMPALEALLLQLWVEHGLNGVVPRAMEILSNRESIVQLGGTKLLAAKNVSSAMLHKALISLKHRRALNLARLGAIKVERQR